jgi:hypothetical protein
VGRKGLNALLIERARSLVDRVHGMETDLHADLSGMMGEAKELLGDSDAPSLKGVKGDWKRLAPLPGGASGPERLGNLHEALSDCSEQLRWSAAAAAIYLTMERSF